jgi:phosphoribosylaminoimidazole-succinocarboxamide synthase
MRDLPLPHVHSGKVRDIYAVGDDRLLMVTSDRLSAFDVVMAEPIPNKGRVLTAMTAFWFELFADMRAMVGSHLLSTDVADLPPAVRDAPDLAGRVMLCRRAEMLPVECIVRGYITGSAWKEYKKGGTMHGMPLPAGLLESARLPEPVFTPSTKAAVGNHDENISFAAAVALVGSELAGRLRDVSLALYSRGAAWAAERGIIIADTKFELGLIPKTGELVLCDEVLPRLLPLLASRGVEARHHTPVLRQTTGARLPGDARLEQDAAPTAVAARGRRRHQHPLRRGLRAHHRPAIRQLARRRRGLVSSLRSAGRAAQQPRGSDNDRMRAV